MVLLHLQWLPLLLVVRTTIGIRLLQVGDIQTGLTMMSTRMGLTRIGAGGTMIEKEVGTERAKVGHWTRGMEMMMPSQIMARKGQICVLRKGILLGHLGRC